MRIQQAVPAARLVCVELNPGPRRSPRLTEEQRWRVIHLSTESHLSIRRIAKQMKVAKKTVEDLLHKYSKSGSVRDRPGRGRKRKLTKDDERRIVKKAKKEKCATEIVRELKTESGIIVSDRTVRDVIRKQNLRFLVKQTVEELSATNQELRLDYARAMKKHNWRKVFFSDEKTFYLGSIMNRAWQEPGKRKKYPVKRYPPKINVWAAAGTFLKSKLYFFRKNMDGPLYQKILKSRLRNDRITFAPDAPLRLPTRFEFLQDNARPHKAKDSMTELKELVDNRRIVHPAQSPDLNIMEDLWSYLDHKAKAANIKTIAGLKRKLSMEWEKMPWSVIRKSVSSMPARLAECEKLQGARTHY
jgi:transposase